MIDFSKAPEGATHYIKGSDVVECIVIVWGLKNKVLWINGDEFTWGNCKVWYKTSGLVAACDPLLIPNLAVASQPQLDDFSDKLKGFSLIIVTCDNERQKMLCEQVIRMDRGKESQYRLCGLDACDWTDKTTDSISICAEYREKPKKELVVPWDVLANEVTVIRVDSNGCIYDGNTPLRIKLDLTDIELPVTVKRP